MTRPIGPIEGDFGLCNACGRRDMRLAYFAHFLLERKCATCGHEARSTPPKLNKTLIYLDQWVISELANSLDPVLRERKAARLDPFWKELYAQLDRLLKLHVVLCPESPIHQRESMVTPYLGPLRHLYEHLAHGVKLREPHEIHASQLSAEFNRVVRGKGDGSLGRDRVMHGRPNEWLDNIRINARIEVPSQQIAAETESNALADTHLGADSAHWRAHPKRKFKEWYDYHRRDLTNVVLHCYESNVADLYWQACRGMEQSLIYDGFAHDNAVAVVRDFLRSDEATRVPYCDISALMYAGMSSKIAQGQADNADHSHYNDIHAIAAYLPYVDIMCVDGYFAEIMRKGPIAKRLRGFTFETYSRKERRAFLSRLTQLEAGTGADLRNTVLSVYGARWLEPYNAILEYHRRKEASKESAPRP